MGFDGRANEERERGAEKGEMKQNELIVRHSIIPFLVKEFYGSFTGYYF